MLKHKLSFAVSVTSVMIFSSLLMADNSGADPGLSGAPGDSTCIACHGTKLNAGTGNVLLQFANGKTYTPGKTQLVTVTVTDPTAKRWGFEASPRLTSSGGTTGAGTVATVDSNTRIAGTRGTLQWITHTLSGTRLGTTGSVSFQFNWTPPATDVGSVDFYVAANAANGNNRDDSGDLIYTGKATLTAAAPASSTAPTIQSNGVLNAASASTTIEAGSWVSLYGTNFAPSTGAGGRTWTSAEIVNGKLPTSLDGVSVTIDGKAAAIAYVSDTQLNVQAPDDSATGPVPVVVTNANGTSATAMVNLQQYSPGLFNFSPQSGKYPAAVFPDGNYVGPAGLFGPSVTTRPAKAGETIILFGTGFGPTSPSVASGQVFSGAAATASPVTATLGGIPVTVTFAGLSGAGLYQVNMVVPVNAPSGDQLLVLSAGGVSTQGSLYVDVQ